VAKATPFNIPKREVWEAFKKVKARKVAASNISWDAAAESTGPSRRV
jgi:hypothetical protein